MKRLNLLMCIFVVCLLSATALEGQEPDGTSPNATPPASTASSAQVPRLVRFSGVLRDLTGKPLTGPVDLHFSIYKEQADAAPLFQETQTLQLDEQGHYTVLLGGMQPEGLPIELFTTGEARWLGVAAGTLLEQSRTLLVSVPYALKANDAEMLGGKPASAYMLAPPTEGATSGGEVSSGGTPAGASAGAASQNLKPGKSGASPKPYATPIATNYIPVFASDGGALGSSVMYQSGSNIGVGTLTPQAALDVNGKARVAYAGFGGLTLTGSQQSSFVLTNAAGAGGFNVGRSLTSDNGQNFFLFDRAAGATRLFIDASGNLGIGTTAPTAPLHVNGKALVSYTGFAGLTLTGSQQSSLILTNAVGAGGFNLGRSLSSDNSQNFFVYDRGAGATRLFIDSSGNVGVGKTAPAAKLDVAGNANFANGVTAASFTGNGAGLTSLNPASLSAGTANINISGNAATATTAASATIAVNADTVDGVHSAGFAQLGANTFTGDQTIAGGNLNLPGTPTGGATGVVNLGGASFIHACCSSKTNSNIFIGRNTGNFTVTGIANTATGYAALAGITTGEDNTATGYTALLANTRGDDNTAIGMNALRENTAGGGNTAVGVSALFSNSTSGGNTAVGVHALVDNCQNVADDCSANYNTALGIYAGATLNFATTNVTGAKNTFLGAYSGPGTSTPINNATAIGANAVVGASNALVLGSIDGVNDATASVNVGIGTPTPQHTLDVVGDINTSGYFLGDGSQLTNITATTASALSCTGCVTLSELDFVPVLQSDLTTETSERQSQDNNLQSSISSESSTRTARDNALSVRGINYLAGCDNCSPLTDNDDQMRFYVNVVGTLAISQVSCFSDAGNPTINLQRDDGTPANMLAADLTCSPTGNSTAAFVAGENWLDVNQALNFIMVSAGGVAKRVTVVIKAGLI